MSEQHGRLEPGAVWRSQPREEVEMNVRQFVVRRTGELHSATRWEILGSFAAAIFFVAIVAWRLTPREEVLAWAALAAVLVWILASLYWFRRRIWPRAPGKDAMAASCLEHYREELRQRRDHLRSEWLWHGPLFVACLVFVAAVGWRAYPGFGRLLRVTPLLGLLAAWVIFGLWQRRSQANQIQQEIDELERTGRQEKIE